MAHTQEIMDALRNMGVEFLETASLQQLKVLLTSTVGAPLQTGKPTGTKASVPLAPAVTSATEPCNVANLSKESTETSGITETSAQTATSAQAATLAPPAQAATSAPSEQASTSAPSVLVETSVKTPAQNELAELEEQLSLKLRILKLKQQINDLEGVTMPRQPLAKFSDVQNALSQFSGDDEADICKWIRDIESISRSYGYDEKALPLLARRMLTGSAQMCVKLVTAHSSNEFKTALIQEFKKPISVKDVFKKLENRAWEKNESLTHYVLSMQEIAQGEEGELVEFIVDGLRDNTGSALIFGGVSTLEALKSLLPKYEKIKTKNSNTTGEIRYSVNELSVRCFNCSRYGHMAKDCKREKRVRGSCFRCGKMDQEHKNCPTKTVAAMEDDEFDPTFIRFKELPQ